MKQVLINVLGNALKFTEHGGIALRASTYEVPEGEDQVGLRFEVEDTGVGIAPDELEQVFRAFEQTQAGRSSQAGTGLGMPISREFARLMGGDLTLKSQLGSGSTFTLTIVVERGAHDELEAAGAGGRVMGLAEGHEPPLVLIVDDQPANRQILKELLSSVGIPSAEAVDGADAIEKFEEVGPDLVFMDVKMPRMDGLEATRRIREKEGGEGLALEGTPIVILTASVFEEDRVAVAHAGADAFLMKPFKEEAIWRIMEWLLEIEFQREEEAPEDAVLAETQKLGREDVLALDDQVLMHLRDAVECGDLDRAAEILEPAEAGHPEVVGHLQSLLRQYDYEGLAALL